MKKIIHKNINRRKFLQGIALTAMAPIAMQSFSFAADNTLSESDPMAKAIKYVKDAKKANLTKDKAGQMCRSCQFYTKDSGDGEKELGKCVITAGKLVYGQGWCTSWVKKA